MISLMILDLRCKLCGPKKGMDKRRGSLSAVVLISRILFGKFLIQKGVNNLINKS